MAESRIPTFRRFFRVVLSAAQRFYWDDCFSRASALAYTTLFALVPILVIVFQLLPALGLEQEEMAATVNSVLEEVLPEVDGLNEPSESKLIEINKDDELIPRVDESEAFPPPKQSLKEVVYENLIAFTTNVRALNTISFLILFVTGILLLNTIESALNVVWRISSTRSIVTKFITFWAVITFGPGLIAIWHARVISLTENSPFLQSPLFGFMDVLLPVGFTWGALVMLFYTLPSARVRLRDAAFGSLISAILFQFVKKGFAYYMSLSTTYNTVYGAFMVVPVFLVWLYITWVVILYGAEVTHQSGAVDIQRGLKKYATELGEIGAILGLRILHCIGTTFRDGELPPSESDISLETGSDPTLVRNCLDIMTEANLLTVANDETQARSLAKSPEKIQLEDVFKTFLSKQHLRITQSEDAEEDLFLNLLRERANSLGPERSIGKWTLRELIE